MGSPARGRWRRPAADVTLAAVAVLVDLLLFSTLATEQGRAGDAPDAAIIGYAILGGAALAWRRRAPLPVYVFMWLHAVGSAVVPGYRPTVGLLVALYTVAARYELRSALWLLLAATVPGGLVVAQEAENASPDERSATILGVGVFLALLHCAVWTVGRVVRAGRERARELERRRVIAAREAVAAERARVARELHDIVAHTVTLMSLHAAGARRVLRRDPQRAERALADVGELGTQAMAELRRMLLVLRADGVDQQASADQPALAARRAIRDLDELLNGVRSTGVQVSLDVIGAPGPLDPSVETAAYRVVQEATTNVVKHAGLGSRAAVRVEWSPDALLVEVTNDGQGASEPSAARLSTGHGLLGLRERVTVVGGELEAVPLATGGFRVAARLPLAGAAHDGEPALAEVGGGDASPDTARR